MAPHEQKSMSMSDETSSPHTPLVEISANIVHSPPQAQSVTEDNLRVNDADQLPRSHRHGQSHGQDAGQQTAQSGFYNTSIGQETHYGHGSWSGFPKLYTSISIPVFSHASRGSGTGHVNGNGIASSVGGVEDAHSLDSMTTRPSDQTRSSKVEHGDDYAEPLRKDVANDKALTEPEDASAKSEAALAQNARDLELAAIAETEEMRIDFDLNREARNAWLKDGNVKESNDEEEVTGTQREQARKQHFIKYGESKEQRTERRKRDEALNFDVVKNGIYQLSPAQFKSLDAEELRKLAIIAEQCGGEHACVVARALIQHKAMEDFANLPDKVEEIWRDIKKCDEEGDSHANCRGTWVTADTHNNADSLVPQLQEDHTFENRPFLTQEQWNAEKAGQQIVETMYNEHNRLAKIDNDALRDKLRDDESAEIPRRKPHEPVWQEVIDDERTAEDLVLAEGLAKEHLLARAKCSCTAGDLVSDPEPNKVAKRLVGWKEGADDSATTEAEESVWNAATARNEALYSAVNAIRAEDLKRLMPLAAGSEHSTAKEWNEDQARRDYLDAILTGSLIGGVPGLSDALQHLALEVTREELEKRKQQEAAFDENLAMAKAREEEEKREKRLAKSDKENLSNEAALATAKAAKTAEAVLTSSGERAASVVLEDAGDLYD